MKIKSPKPIMVDAKTLRIFMKVRDEFCADIVSSDGEIIGGSTDVYVPDFMPQRVTGATEGSHFGDYLILDIDLDSGLITNWKTPMAEQIEKFILGDLD